MPNTLRKVESFMLKERSTKKTYTPTYNRIYLLSDSKGNYLRREQYAVGDIVDTSPVSYWTKKGGPLQMVWPIWKVRLGTFKGQEGVLCFSGILLVT